MRTIVFSTLWVQNSKIKKLQSQGSAAGLNIERNIVFLPPNVPQVHFYFNCAHARRP